MSELTGVLPTWTAAFVSGLFSFISPAFLALAPVALVYVTGVSLERRAVGGGGWRFKGSLLLHLSCFVAGFTAVLASMAAGHTAVGRFLLMGERAFTAAGGLFVAVLGIFMTGLVPQASLGDIRFRWRHRAPGYAASAAVGAAHGLVWSPCVGPTLGAIILAAGTPEAAGRALPLIIVHGAGFGLPFLAFGLLIDGALQGVRSPRAVIVLEKASGALLAAVGLLISTGTFIRFTEGLFQTFDFWVQVLIQGGL